MPGDLEFTFRAIDKDGEIIHEWLNPEPARSYTDDLGHYHAIMELQIPSPRPETLYVAGVQILMNGKYLNYEPVKGTVDGQDCIMVAPGEDSLTIEQEVVIS